MTDSFERRVDCFVHLIEASDDDIVHRAGTEGLKSIQHLRTLPKEQRLEAARIFIQHYYALEEGREAYARLVFTCNDAKLRELYGVWGILDARMIRSRALPW